MVLRDKVVQKYFQSKLRFLTNRAGTFLSPFLSKLAETKIVLELSIIVMRHTINKGEDLGGKCCLFGHRPN